MAFSDLRGGLCLRLQTLGNEQLHEPGARDPSVGGQAVEGFDLCRGQPASDHAPTALMFGLSSPGLTFRRHRKRVNPRAGCPWWISNTRASSCAYAQRALPVGALLAGRLPVCRAPQLLQEQFVGQE